MQRTLQGIFSPLHFEGVEDQNECGDVQHYRRRSNYQVGVPVAGECPLSRRKDIEIGYHNVWLSGRSYRQKRSSQRP